MESLSPPRMPQARCKHGLSPGVLGVRLKGWTPSPTRSPLTPIVRLHFAKAQPQVLSCSQESDLTNSWINLLSTPRTKLFTSVTTLEKGTKKRSARAKGGKLQITSSRWTTGANVNSRGIFLSKNKHNTGTKFFFPNFRPFSDAWR